MGQTYRNPATKWIALAVVVVSGMPLFGGEPMAAVIGLPLGSVAAAVMLRPKAVVRSGGLEVRNYRGPTRLVRWPDIADLGMESSVWLGPRLTLRLRDGEAVRVWALSWGRGGVGGSSVLRAVDKIAQTWKSSSRGARPGNERQI